MGIPWRFAVKAIPWNTILANAPSILRSANALLSETKVRSGAAASRTDLEALAERIEALEQRDRQTAELLTRITAQIARWLFVVAIAASVVALVACGIALFVQ
jgi:hypothetical protein